MTSSDATTTEHPRAEAGGRPAAGDAAPASERSVAGRLPGRSGRALLLGAVLTVLALVGVEAFWRSVGIPRSATDNLDLWARSRRSIGTGRSDEVVLVGASRTQLVDFEALTEGTGWSRPSSIAKGGISPVPLLASLARQDDFRGVVVCGVAPSFFFDANPGRGGKARNLLDAWRGQMPVARIEHAMRLWLQMRLSLLNKTLALQELLEPFFELRLPDVPSGVVQPERSRFIDFLAGDLETSRRVNVNVFTRTSRQPNRQQLESQLGLLAGLTKRIRDRGGEVVFVRMPSSGPVLAAEREDWPRRKLWDRMAREVGGVFVHFEDHPELSRYDCPDYSHLNSPDAVPFSRDLGRILAERVGPRDGTGPPGD